ncbi:(2Fe-2S)-binding protein [Sphingomonas xinjiangensis]|uniref:Isoquinoline 1-oxidoreductase alpha subunit n=1 Tax=Sphingomonas xinjiangensis TaxID=643568 RepID=A0A840YKU8_9SPHN|nr:(2Fe-2S)-binding protein [Sphingomonas xinjiangensis]MBB5711848.1 isoquinoline 1-oxidoreductase alpha subunit [Sphingomonas xinjiangensis]
MAEFELNGKAVSVEVDAGTPLLWVLRDDLGLTGTKYGCGIAQCGACTVHMNGEATRSCLLPIEDVHGARVTTIEGLGQGGLHPVQELWLKHQVPQCGYCQSGMIMAAAALLSENPNPSDEDIMARMTNICRCGTYSRVRAALEEARGGNRMGAPA